MEKKEGIGKKQAGEWRSKLPSQELSPAEQKEYEQAQNLFKQVLADNLQSIQEQFQKVQEQAGKEPAPQMPKLQAMERFAEQAEQLREQIKDLQEAVKEDRVLSEQLETLQQQAEQIKDIAEYISEPEKEVDLEEEPIIYNIKEYGIDESKLTEEQKEILEKIRHFAQETSKVYRSVMRMLINRKIPILPTRSFQKSRKGVTICLFFLFMASKPVRIF